jgi:hypothetical protein
MKTTTANSTYPKMAVQWLNQALCFYQSFCLVDSEVLQTLRSGQVRNRHLRVAVKRQDVKKFKLNAMRMEYLKNCRAVQVF